MARASTASLNSAIQAILPTAGTFYITLHSADPGTTGASEFTTVTRQTYTPGTASGGAVANTNSIAVANAGSQSATYIGIWSALTGGSYVIGAALSSAVTAATVTFSAGAASFTAS